MKDIANPLVSVIIPVYNSGKYLPECLDAVLSQSWRNIEVIIIDDGSTDNSLEIAGSYKDERITVFSQANKGASAARNYGLTKATGSFIQFLDADDILSSNKIAAQVEVLISNPGKVAVCSTVHFFDGEDHLKMHPSAYENSYLINDDDPAHFLLNLWGAYHNSGSMIQPNVYLTPIEIINRAGPWNEFKCPDDDGEFFCRVLLAGSGIIYTPNCFNYYRKFKNAGSLSSQKNLASFESVLLSAKLKFGYLKKATDRPEVDQVFAKTFLETGILTYPQFRELSKQAVGLSKSLSGSVPEPVIGGRAIELIKKQFGWKTARLLQYYFQKLTHKPA